MRCHLNDGAIAGIAQALWRGATLPPETVSELALALTTWAKDLLGEPYVLNPEPTNPNL